VLNQHEASPKPLSQEQEVWLRRAWDQIDEEELARLIVDMVNIPSPPGEEKGLAKFMVEWMATAGLDAFYQEIDPDQGNAIGYFRGSGGGPTLLLWGELDMFLGMAQEERFGLGSVSRRELQSKATREGEYIIGLGADNPKGHAACAAMALKAVIKAAVPLKGTVILGLPAGGMPTNSWDPENTRKNVAQGVGCEYMLQQGIYPDFAIAAKPVYAVSWEEAGLCWFKIGVKGNCAYTGTRHMLPYKNSIVDAAKVIQGLEEWFPEYARRNASGNVAPQAQIGAIEGGRAYKPSLCPEICNLYLDLRVAPGMHPMDAKRQLEEALSGIQARHPELDLDCEMILSIPGTRTEPSNWIVESCIRGWEYVEQKKHKHEVAHSGATDVNIIRAHGIPVARLGTPPFQLPGGMRQDLLSWMGTASTVNLARLVKCYIYSVIDTCTRSIEEVGLATKR